MSSAHNTSFVEGEDLVHWMTMNGKGERVRDSSIEAWRWKEIKLKFYSKKDFCSREDFVDIFNESTHHAYSNEMASDAYRDLSQRKRNGIDREIAYQQQRERIQPGELALPFAPCTLGDRTHPLCCLNKMNTMEMDGEMLTSTPKVCHSRPAHFGDISRVVATPLAMRLPLHVDTTPSRSALATALGSQASSRRTSFSSARSLRAGSESSQEDTPFIPALIVRRTPKRLHESSSSSSRNSVHRATQVKRARTEPQPGLVGLRSPATPGAQSPSWPEPTEMDWNQPSTSGPQPRKVCRNGATCSSKCAKGPCHEEMF